MEKETDKFLEIELAKQLVKRGHRVFSIDIAKSIAQDVGINDIYIEEYLHYLKSIGWITFLKKRLYALSPILLVDNPVHEYEIAMALIHPAAIAYGSAAHHHKLTEQLFQKIYILTTDDVNHPKGGMISNSEYRINGKYYHFTKVKKVHYFGIEEISVGEMPIIITDLERTLIDGLVRPNYCGGFSNVIQAFYCAKNRINIEKIFGYANKYNISVVRRLGWMLEEISIPKEELKTFSILYKTYIKLDPSQSLRGEYNKEWGLRINI